MDDIDDKVFPMDFIYQNVIYLLYTIVSVLWSVIIVTLYIKNKNFRKYYYSFTYQIVLNTLALLFILIINVIVNLYWHNIMILIYFVLVFASECLSMFTILLSYAYIILGCTKVIKNEEIIFRCVWKFTITSFVIILILIQYKLDIKLSQMQIIIIIITFEFETILFIYLIKMVNEMRKIKKKLCFILTVHILPMFCDILMLIYGTVLVIGVPVDLFLIPCQVMAFIQTLLLFYRRNSEWKMCTRRENDQQIEMS